MDKSKLPKTKKLDSKTVFNARHVPLSVSVSSNVPGYDEPKFLRNHSDEQHLIDEFVDYLEEISLKSFELMKKQYAHVYDQLAEREQEEQENTDKKFGLSAASLKAVLDSYLQELPVLGFNSSNYDINVIKRFLFKKLCAADNERTPDNERASESDEEDERASESLDERAEECKWETRDGIKFLVKQNNQFKCIATPSLNFLDIGSYLAPGCSYAHCLVAFGV